MDASGRGLCPVDHAEGSVPQVLGACSCPKPRKQRRTWTLSHSVRGYGSHQLSKPMRTCRGRARLGRGHGCMTQLMTRLYPLTQLYVPTGLYVLTGMYGMWLQDTPVRIVAVSSIGHAMGSVVLDDLHFKNRSYGPWKSYGQSKLANILFAKELARR